LMDARDETASDPPTTSPMYALPVLSRTLPRNFGLSSSGALGPHHEPVYNAMLEKLNPDKVLAYSLAPMNWEALEKQRAKMTAAKEARDAARAVREAAREALRVAKAAAMAAKAAAREAALKERARLKEDERQAFEQAKLLHVPSMGRSLLTRQHTKRELVMEMETSSSFREAWKGVNQHLAPMLVVRLEDFELFGEIPRFSDEVGVPFLDLPADMKVVFVSHRWARASEQPPHPDHPDNSKHRLIVEGVKQVARERRWKRSGTLLWIDYSCINQEEPAARDAGMKALIGYMAMCNAMLVPVSEAPDQYVANLVHLPGDFALRAWLRLEAMVFTALSPLTDGDIYCMAEVDTGFFFKRLQYDFGHNLPSTGDITDLEDMPYLRRHETKVLEFLEYARKDLNMLAGLMRKDAVTGLGLAAGAARTLLEAGRKCVGECAELHLHGNTLAPEGAASLATLVAEQGALAGCLTSLHLDGNMIKEKGCASLAQALAQNKTLMSLEMAGNAVRDEGASCIGDLLAVNHTITCLDVSNNSIGTEGAKAIAKGLWENPVLVDLCMSENAIKDKGVKFFVQLLEVNTTIKYLDLNTNEVGPRGSALLLDTVVKQGDRWVTVNSIPIKEMRENKLRTLKLRGRGMSVTGVSLVSTYLSCCNELSQLHLPGNSIGADGAKALAAALKDNLTVTELSLENNHLKKEGVEVLAEMLITNRRLYTVDLSGNDILHTGGRQVIDDICRRGGYRLVEGEKQACLVLRRTRPCDVDIQNNVIPEESEGNPQGLDSLLLGSDSIAHFPGSARAALGNQEEYPISIQSPGREVLPELQPGSGNGRLASKAKPRTERIAGKGKKAPASLRLNTKLPGGVGSPQPSPSMNGGVVLSPGVRNRLGGISEMGRLPEPGSIVNGRSGPKSPTKTSRARSKSPMKRHTSALEPLPSVGNGLGEKVVCDASQQEVIAPNADPHASKHLA